MESDYKPFAFGLAKKAGQIIKTNFTLWMGKQWKSDNTPVTETDLVINKLVIDSVKKEFPYHSILAEEGSDFSDQSEFVWVCDPVDGTIPFSHGIPTCVFSLGLVRSGEAVLGIVYDPFMERLFFAEKGNGSFLNDKRLSVSPATGWKSQLVGVSVWKNLRINSSAIGEELVERGAHVINVGSITYMGALLASGELAATVFQGNKPPDTAALKVIVEEAGGRVTDLFGNEQRYDRDINGHTITNGILHKELVEMVSKHIKR